MATSVSLSEAKMHLIVATLTAKAYKLAGRTEFRGLSISIETKKGQIRKGVGADGKPWSIKMPFAYGYIRGTVGADGAHIDCFIGPNAEAEHVYVIHQHKENSDTYDEDKVMLGFDSQEEARDAYDSAYNIDIFLGMHEFNFEDFCNEIEKKHGKALECGGPGSGRHKQLTSLDIADVRRTEFNQDKQQIKNIVTFLKDGNTLDDKKEPIKVVPGVDGNKPYYITDGHHRYLAFKKLGHTTIQVLVEDRKQYDDALPPGVVKAGGPGSGEYVHKKGFHLASTDRTKWDDHLKGLKIPPGAKSVEYNPDKDTHHLIAVWYDQKDRDHPIYHEDFNNSQAEIKFTRVSALLKERAKIEKQLVAKQGSDDPKTVEHADAASLINKTGIRPGSATDTGAEVKAYGATTLEGRHVVTDDKGNTSLQFVGKEGKSLNIPVEDKATATMLRARKDRSGDNGQLFPNVSQKSLGEFTHTLDGGNFKTKDMRTALGTETAQKLVDSMPVPKDEKEYKSAVKGIAITVSQKLGNTPAMALKAYIAPQIFSKWRSHVGIA